MNDRALAAIQRTCALGAAGCFFAFFVFAYG